MSETQHNYTIPPRVTSPIELAIPRPGLCALHLAGDSAPDHALVLCSDSSGNVRFHLHPSGSSNEVIQLLIDCKSDGPSAQVPLSVRFNAVPTKDMPLPSSEVLKTKIAEGGVRPALSREEVEGLADHELFQRGYPLRPDAEKDPAAYARWRGFVSTRLRLLRPELVPRMDVRHRPQTGVSEGTEEPNWSGYEVRNGPFSIVIGYWTVPEIVASEGVNQQTMSSLWVGLDGDPNTPGTVVIGGPPTDLVQIGTEQDNVMIPISSDVQNAPGSSLYLNASAYYAWTQFIPQQECSQQLANFPVDPGDEIFARVWIATSGQSFPPSLESDTAYFQIVNRSQKVDSGMITMPKGTTVVTGVCADWIMERPSTAPTIYSDLADYGVALMESTVAMVDGSEWGFAVPGGWADVRQLTMISEVPPGNPLSTANLSGNEMTIEFTWVGFR